MFISLDWPTGLSEDLHTYRYRYMTFSRIPGATRALFEAHGFFGDVLDSILGQGLLEKRLTLPLLLVDLKSSSPIKLPRAVVHVVDVPDHDMSCERGMRGRGGKISSRRPDARKMHACQLTRVRLVTRMLQMLSSRMVTEEERLGGG